MKDFSNIIQDFNSLSNDYHTAEQEVLAEINRFNYPQQHPFLKYPHTPESMDVTILILLKTVTQNDTLINDYIKRCKAVENGKFNYDRYRQAVNEVLFLYYLIIGILDNAPTMNFIVSPPDKKIIDNDKISEYSIEIEYNEKKYILNIEVKTLSCEALPTDPRQWKDGKEIIIPYNDESDFINELSLQYPKADVMKEKCLIFPLMRNIKRIKTKFEGNNLTNESLYNIGVIFIDRAASIEQFHSYLFNDKFGIIPKTDIGNIDMLVLMTMDAKVDIKMSNIYNMGYVQTILFKDEEEYINISRILRLDNFMKLGNELATDVSENAKKEYEHVKILHRDGFVNLIPYESTEEEIQEYLDFLKSDTPRYLE